MSIETILQQAGSREELLQLGGALTVNELKEIGYGPEEILPGGGIARGLLYENDTVPVRLIPQTLLNQCQLTWRTSGEIGPVIKKIWEAFFVYRETVNRDFLAPLVEKVDGVWEWPDPATGYWDGEQIQLQAFLLGAYKPTKDVQIIVDEPDTRHTLTPATGIIDTQTTARLITQPDETIQYTIPVLDGVRMINQQAWQVDALNRWARPLAHAVEDLLAGSLNENKAETFFLSMIPIIASSTINYPVVKYATNLEKANPSNLFISGF